MNISTTGVLVFEDSFTAVELKELARKIERLGYSALWFTELFGRDPFGRQLYGHPAPDVFAGVAQISTLGCG
jgi:alkanesulfonate monooxygenase SsuD/methylene tetrahydromethanopterin reductase-like flavin-dependent oxidoreductase (luciferase family)